MTHPLVLALFTSPSSAARAAAALHARGIGTNDLSVIARTHAEEVRAAHELDATPGVEMEDSLPAARLGELSAHVLAAMALVMPGIGPVVAGGPLAAEMGEAAGQAAGSLADRLERAGFPRDQADIVETAVEQGSWLLGAHVRGGDAAGLAELMREAGATLVREGRWKD